MKGRNQVHQESGTGAAHLHIHFCAGQFLNKSSCLPEREPKIILNYSKNLKFQKELLKKWTVVYKYF